jgi:hypothetical protein
MVLVLFCFLVFFATAISLFFSAKLRSILGKYQDSLPSAGSMLHKYLTSIYFIASLVIIPFYSIYYFLSNRDSLNILTILEHFFLWFLPPLISLSFYNLFETIFESHKYSKPLTDNDSALINLSKKVFLSSLISYLIIKFIELLSEKDDEIALEAIDEIVKKVTTENIENLNVIDSLRSIWDTSYTSVAYSERVDSIEKFVRTAFENAHAERDLTINKFANLQYINAIVPYDIIQMAAYLLLVIVLIVFYLRISGHEAHKDK